MDGVVDMDQGLGEGPTEAQEGKLDSEVFWGDTEVELVLHRSGTDERGLSGADVREVPEASGTQREDWSHMGPLYGARPKGNRMGQLSGMLEAEATGGKVDYDMEERGVPATLLPLLRQNS